MHIILWTGSGYFSQRKSYLGYENKALWRAISMLGEIQPVTCTLDTRWDFENKIAEKILIKWREKTHAILPFIED